MKKSIFLAPVLLISILCQAQMKGSSQFDLNWGIGSTINNSFVSGFATRGGSFGYSVFPKDDLSVGLELGWNNYWRYVPTTTYQFKDGAATTDLYKYIFNLPITMNVTKYYYAGRLFSPYLRLGVGAQYSEQNLYYNIFETTHSDWGLVIKPVAGVRIHPSKYSPFSLNLGLGYQYATNSVSQYNISNMQAYNINIGASWKF
jgi:hypothetical protein